ncbi:MAG: hypothetical protein KAI24_21965 [Planctomycetes bacterium]|nr:hypothetical protein [Planctomycetota bacterium]
MRSSLVGILLLSAACSVPFAKGAQPVGSHVVDVGLLLPENLKADPFVEEQRAWFKKALSAYVHEVWPTAIQIAEPTVAVEPTEFWYDSKIEDDRLAEVQRAARASLDSKHSTVTLELVRHAAGCVPLRKGCNDPDSCPWDTQRSYHVWVDGVQLTCAGAIAKYEAWRGTRHNEPEIDANGPLAQVPLVVVHSHVYLPTPPSTLRR